MTFDFGKGMAAIDLTVAHHDQNLKNYYRENNLSETDTTLIVVLFDGALAIIILEEQVSGDET